VSVEAGFCNDYSDLARHGRQVYGGDAGIKLTVVGCSPAWPNPGGAQSGYLLESGGRRLLLDCGPGVLARLRERWSWPEVDAIALTHWHLDHWGDIVPWVWGQTLGPGTETRKPELWIPPDGQEVLTAVEARVGQPEMFSGAFEIHEYEDGREFETAGFRVTPLRVLHYTMLAFGFRAAANGSVLAYSGDSGPSDALPQLASGADLFLCEATLLQPNPEGGTRGHLAATEAVDAFEASDAKRLLLTHRPSERPLENGLEQAHDGMELEL
jgi:ribonuclease BN (tRNA processing enzyme)